MSPINLEAEQIVSEELEQAPRRRRNIFGGRIILIFSAIIVVEAVLLFFVFEFLEDDAPRAAAESATPVLSIQDLSERLENAHKIEVGPVSILDENARSPRADRHFSCRFEVYLEQNTYEEIRRVADRNPHALDLVKRVIEREIRHWMLEVGGEALKDKEMQGKRDRQLRDHLNDRLPALRNRIIDVFQTDFTVRRY